MEELIPSTQPLPDYCNTLVIDGDAIPYIIGWNNKEHTEIEVVQSAVNQWMKDFLAITQAPHFIGILAADNAHCFRYDVYKYKPYKGNRQREKEPWIVYWEPIIRSILVTEWKFIYAPTELETDDVVAFYANGNPKAVICSPDKDLKQIPGYFYIIKDLGGENHKRLEIVDSKQAMRNFCMQLLTGDTTDNIAGVTGMGEVKAKKLLDETSELAWIPAIKLAYQKQYGPYYGQIIYEETLAVIQMMTPTHPLWNIYGNLLTLDLPIQNSADYGRFVHEEIERETSL